MTDKIPTQEIMIGTQATCDGVAGPVTWTAMRLYTPPVRRERYVPEENADANVDPEKECDTIETSST